MLSLSLNMLTLVALCYAFWENHLVLYAEGRDALSLETKAEGPFSEQKGPQAHFIISKGWLALY